MFVTRDHGILLVLYLYMQITIIAEKTYCELLFFTKVQVFANEFSFYTYILFQTFQS